MMWVELGIAPRDLLEADADIVAELEEYLEEQNKKARSEAMRRDLAGRLQGTRRRRG